MYIHTFIFSLSAKAGSFFVLFRNRRKIRLREGASVFHIPIDKSDFFDYNGYRKEIWKGEIEWIFKKF